TARGIEPARGSSPGAPGRVLPPAAGVRPRPGELPVAVEVLRRAPGQGRGGGAEAAPGNPENLAREHGTPAGPGPHAPHRVPGEGATGRPDPAPRPPGNRPGPADGRRLPARPRRPGAVPRGAGGVLRREDGHRAGQGPAAGLRLSARKTRLRGPVA